MRTPLSALAVLTTCAALAAAGCDASGGAAHAAEVASAPDLSAGLEVYHAQYCGLCHTLAAAGTTGAFGPSHDSLWAKAAERIEDPDYKGSATTPEEYVRESIVDPGAYRVPGFKQTRFDMPSFAYLDDAQIDALVTLLLTKQEPD